MPFRVTWSLLLGFLALLPAAWGQGESVTAADLLEFIPEVVADYGQGEQIRGEEVKPLIAPQVQAMLANGAKPTPEQVRAWTASLVDGMINQRLVLREAARQGVTPDLEAGRRLVASQQERLGDKAFERVLRLQGVSADQLARHLAENEAVNRWLESIGPAPESITEAAARTYYQQHPEEFRRPAVYHVWHLLVAVPEDAAAEAVAAARQRADGLRALAARGESFAALAAAHSDCPSKLDGGDLGPLPAGRLPPAFESAALALMPGQISDPVRSPQGWHLIRGGIVIPGAEVPFASVCEDIVAALQRTAIEEARHNLIRRLREQAHVSVYVSAP